MRRVTWEKVVREDISWENVQSRNQQALGEKLWAVMENGEKGKEKVMGINK